MATKMNTNKRISLLAAAALQEVAVPKAETTYAYIVQNIDKLEEVYVTSSVAAAVLVVDRVTGKSGIAVTHENMTEIRVYGTPDGVTTSVYSVVKYPVLTE